MSRTATLDDLHRERGKAELMYRRRETAEAEPAVPGWSMPVDGLFPA